MSKNDIPAIGSYFELTPEQRAQYDREANEFMAGWAAERGLCGKKGHADDCRCDWDDE